MLAEAVVATTRPPPLAAALATTPPYVLQEQSRKNAALITHLEGLLRAEQVELDRLRSSKISKRHRRTSVPIAPPSSPCLKSTPPAVSSPTSIMHPANSSAASSTPTSSPAVSASMTTHRRAEGREMAARGSHWSFAEKARFEEAIHKYGPFSWEQIIAAVGTRTDKQVKAYAARYRRRKKLAARMHALSMQHSAAVAVASTPTTSSEEPSLSRLPHKIAPAWDASIIVTEPSAQGCSDGDDPAADYMVPSHPDAAMDSQSLQSRVHGNHEEEDQMSYFDTMEAIGKEAPIDKQTAIQVPAKIEDMLNESVLTAGGVSSSAMPAGTSEIGTEIDLLLDRAMRGEAMEEETEAKPSMVHIAEEPDPSDFLKTLFS